MFPFSGGGDGKPWLWIMYGCVLLSFWRWGFDNGHGTGDVFLENIKTQKEKKKRWRWDGKLEDT